MLKQETKKRLLLLGIILLSLSVLLCTGCERQRYKDEDAEAVTQRGREIIQAWIEEKLPGAEILTVDCDVFQYPSGPSYLTGYVNGTVASGSDRIEFTVNTQTGQVYFVSDMEEFAELAREFIYEAMSLEDPISVREYEVLLELPNAYEGKRSSETLGDTTFTSWVLPAEIALLLSDGTEEGKDAVVSYIRTPENRDALNLRLRADVGDSMELRAYDLERIQSIEADYGLKISGFAFSDSNEEVNGSSHLTEYRLWEWYEQEEFQLRVLKELYSDIRDASRAGKISREHYLFDSSDILLENTPEGYRFLYRKGGTEPQFYVYAKDGATILSHGFYADYEDMENQYELHWAYSDSAGLWVLENDLGFPIYITQPTELTFIAE